MSEHLRDEDCAGLAMLPEDDPERRAAEAHAAECEACRTLLGRAKRDLAGLSRALETRPLSGEAIELAERALFDRLEEIERGEIARSEIETRTSWSGRLGRSIGAWASLAAIPLSALVVFSVLVLLRDPVAPIQWGVSLAVLALVAGRSALSLVRATARDAGFALMLTLSASLVLAWLDASGGDHGHGERCIVLELATALGPLAIALVAARSGVLAPLLSSPRQVGETSPSSASAPLALAAITASGALAGQLALRSACVDRHLEHLLLFHLGGVVLAALLGGAIEARLGTIARTARP